MSLLLARKIRPADGGTGQNPQTLAGLLALCPPGRMYSASPFLPYIGTGWKSGQTQEYVVMVNPLNSAQLIMWYTGELNGGINGGIGVATASATNPTVWTDYASNPIYSTGSQVRLCDVVWDPVASVFNMYVCPADATIVLYTSTNGYNFTAYNSAIPVFQPSQVTGLTGVTYVSGMGVLRVSASLWYGYYSVRSTSGGVLTSIRLATSTDGKNWSDTGTTLLSTAASTYYSTYLEGRNQILKMPDGNYAIVTSAFNGTNWVCAIAPGGASPTSGFAMAATPLLTASGVAGTPDSGLVATPTIANLNGQWYMFYQGTPSPGTNYSYAYWTSMIARF